jgi:hypothetical protein
MLMPMMRCEASSDPKIGVVEMPPAMMSTMSPSMRATIAATLKRRSMRNQISAIAQTAMAATKAVTGHGIAFAFAAHAISTSCDAAMAAVINVARRR